MEYIGTKEAAEKWGVSQNTVSQWCKAGYINGATQKTQGSQWRIPVDATCPIGYKNVEPITTINVNTSIDNPSSLSLIVAECPHCGGELEFKNNSNKILFCPFCGRKLLLNDTNWTEKTIQINKTTTIDDKAAIARAELAKVKAREKRRESTVFLIVMCIMLLILCLLEAVVVIFAD